jgi:hypothetical protein
MGLFDSWFQRKRPDLGQTDVKIGWGPCCFCGGEIAETAVDPCSITVETSKKKWQIWFCHSECFKTRLVKESYMDMTPAHF